MQVSQLPCVSLLMAMLLIPAAGAAAEEATSDLPIDTNTIGIALKGIGNANELAKRIARLAELAAPADDIESLRQQTGAFTPRGLIEPPVIPTDEAFSRDSAKREAARKTWEQFLNDDAAEISRLHQRRDEQVTRAADLEKRIAHLGKSLEELAKTKDDPVVAAFMGDGLKRAYKLAQRRLPIMKDILNNRQRIVQEYDTLLTRREVEHEGHVGMLHALEAIQGIRNEPPAAGAEPPVPAPATGAGQPTKAAPSVVEQKISDRVSARVAPAERQAYQTRQDAARLKHEGNVIARRTPQPTVGYSAGMPTTASRPPDFSAVMTPQSR